MKNKNVLHIDMITKGNWNEFSTPPSQIPSNNMRNGDYALVSDDYSF
jgi:hypothetical protein